MEMHTTHRADQEVAAMPESTFPLPNGTETPEGVIVSMTLTAYEMADGRFVPFVRLHPPTPATPLVVLR